MAHRIHRQIEVPLALTRALLNLELRDTLAERLPLTTVTPARAVSEKVCPLDEKGWSECAERTQGNI